MSGLRVSGVHPDEDVHHAAVAHVVDERAQRGARHLAREPADGEELAAGRQHVAARLGGGLVGLDALGRRGRAPRRRRCAGQAATSRCQLQLVRPRWSRPAGRASRRGPVRRPRRSPRPTRRRGAAPARPGRGRRAAPTDAGLVAGRGRGSPRPRPWRARWWRRPRAGPRRHRAPGRRRRRRPTATVAITTTGTTRVRSRSFQASAKPSPHRAAIGGASAAR